VINTNLATRPFYNDTAVRLWIGLLALVVIAASIFNVTRLLSYSRDDTTQARQASQDEERAAALRARATQLRASVNTTQMDAAAIEASQANDLIDRRTFSWTELFNHFEDALPAEVRITSVRQRTGDIGGTGILITIVARTVDDVYEFTEKLKATRAFSDLLVRDETMDETTSELTAAIEGSYRPASAKPAAAAEQTAAEPQTDAKSETPRTPTLNASPDAPVRDTSGKSRGTR
jgi:hypothetical protein